MCVRTFDTLHTEYCCLKLHRTAGQHASTTLRPGSTATSDNQCRGDPEWTYFDYSSTRESRTRDPDAGLPRRAALRQLLRQQARAAPCALRRGRRAARGGRVWPRALRHGAGAREPHASVGMHGDPVRGTSLRKLPRVQGLNKNQNTAKASWANEFPAKPCVRIRLKRLKLANSRGWRS